jgi:hypothetical protein
MHSAAPQCLENHCAADAEAEDRAKGRSFENGIFDMEIVSDQRSGRKGNSEHVQQKWRVNIRQIAAKSYLQKQGSQTNRGHNDESKRAKECSAAGEDDNQSKRKDEKPGGNHGPSTSYIPRSGIGQRAISPVFGIALL